MKLKELRKLASLHKIKGRSKMNKAQLEVALKPILQAKKSRKRRSVKRKRRSVKKSRKKIKKAAVYCGNNGAATNGKPIGTKHQCLKVGIGKGLYLPCERSYGGVYDPIDDRKMYCGDKIDMPPGYDIMGSPSLCLKVGIGLGKAQRARNGCRKPRRSRKTSRKRKASRKRRSRKPRRSRKTSRKRKASRKKNKFSMIAWPIHPMGPNKPRRSKPKKKRNCCNELKICRNHNRYLINKLAPYLEAARRFNEAVPNLPQPRTLGVKAVLADLEERGLLKKKFSYAEKPSKQPLTIYLTKSKKFGKKWEIKFTKDGKSHKADFGSAGMSDFTKHHDAFRMVRYVRRHGGKIPSKVEKIVEANTNAPTKQRKAAEKKVIEMMKKVTTSPKENWKRNGMHTAGFWSRWLTWSEPSMSKAIKLIEEKFNVKIIKK